jgi:hypothetical protein
LIVPNGIVTSSLTVDNLTVNINLISPAGTIDTLTSTTANITTGNITTANITTANITTGNITNGNITTLNVTGTSLLDGQVTFSAPSNQFRIRPNNVGNSLIFTATNPAGADRTVTFPDPGLDTSVAYTTATQTLTNKSLTAPTITFAQTFVQNTDINTPVDVSTATTSFIQIQTQVATTAGLASDTFALIVPASFDGFAFGKFALYYATIGRYGGTQGIPVVRTNPFITLVTITNVHPVDALDGDLLINLILIPINPI